MKSSMCKHCKATRSSLQNLYLIYKNDTKGKDIGSISNTDSSEFPSMLTDLIKNQLKARNVIEKESFKHDDFIRKAIVNRKDKFGNTMLHLAAWNSKNKMYDFLIKLGADPCIETKDGLTAFTLTVRFGLWEMYDHIWKNHFTTPY
jgi:hypothetical protein